MSLADSGWWRPKFQKRGRADSLLKIKQNGRTNESLDTTCSNENPRSLAIGRHLVP